MCHKKTTIFACNCVLRNHRLCSHSQNITASSIPSHDMEGGSESDSESDFDDSTTVNDDVNEPSDANTASQAGRNKDHVRNRSNAPTITLQVHSPPASPNDSGTATPIGLNAGASPFAPTPSPFGPMTSSIGATPGTSTIYSHLNVDTPSRSATNSPSLFYTPATHTGNSSAAGPSSTTPSHIFFGNILTPIAPTSNLTLPIFGHSASATSNMHQNQNTNSSYRFTFAAPQTTNGALTPVPSGYTLSHLAHARQNANHPDPTEMIKSTLAETCSPSTRDALPSGFYPRHFDSAQRHVHWNEIKTEWVDCAAFYCTHFMDLSTMSAKEKEQEHSDCPEYFGDGNKVVLELDLCKECRGYHYERALREQGGTAEWGMAMAIVNGGGARMGQGQGQGQQTQGQNQTHHQSQQPGMGMGSQHHIHQTGHTYTHSQTTNQAQVVDQHENEEDVSDAKWDTSPAFEAIEKLEARYNLVGRTLLRQRIRERGQTVTVSGQTPLGQTPSNQAQTSFTQVQTPTQHQRTQTVTQIQTRTPPTYAQVTQRQPDMLVGVPGAWPGLQLQQHEEEDESDDDGDDEKDEYEHGDGDGQITPTDAMVDSRGYSMVDRFLRRFGLPTY